MPLGGRVAVVTGASSGIGAALAHRLADEGYRCVLLARREDRLRALAEETGGEYELCDVSDRASVDRAARAVLERHPRISLLVNNAGIAGRTGFLDGDPEAIEGVLRTNFLGSVWCLRAFLPAIDRDVVNIVSVAGAVAVPRGGPYSASKHAQLAFSRSTAAELRARGIRVHTILPGLVETEGFPQRSVRKSPLVKRIVVGPDRVAEHVVSSLRGRGGESFVPRWYRVFALAQAVAPNLVTRALAARLAI